MSEHDDKPDSDATENGEAARCASHGYRENLKDENGCARHCDCCEYYAPLKRFEDMRTSHGIRDLWLCEICASTHLSVAVVYPDQCPDPYLHKAAGWIGNHLLAAIRAR